MRPPVLALTQGDPAGIGPEILLKLLREEPAPTAWRPLLVAERAALEALKPALPDFPWDRLTWLPGPPEGGKLPGGIPVLDPVGSRREISFGHSGPADAAGAMAALDAGIALVRSGAADALVTAPVSKESISRHHLPGFVGHTDYLAEVAGLERYGRDYLMAFLAPELQVALLNVHVPLRQAIDGITSQNLAEALDCLDRHAGGKIALAGLNPHAGEGGLLGSEDIEILAPAVAAARERGLNVHGPESADSLFARARKGEFDWVLALYHDQGLIAVKTASFGTATNWTLGLPFLRTSVDHGTAFPLAGKGVADAGPMAAVVEATLGLISGRLPKKR
ncbi:MAG TPA: 4-hydroxythreonine-4-phosphate dehydrogenase PdxA [Thermoanaerobaculia bacterium]|nr:4-hydroxythreonine-4-phosphate dehydrogenase PdxA [Thermoanaerobaculia bacterium]